MLHVEKHGFELAARYPFQILRCAFVESLGRRVALIGEEGSRRRMLRRLETVRELLASVELELEELS